MKSKLLFYGTAFALVFSIGCDRLDVLEDIQGGWQSSEDYTQAQIIFDDIYKMIDDETQQQDTLRDIPCADVTLDLGANNGFPATLTLDFGTGCLASDGRTRSGVINAVYSGRWRDAGSTVTVSTSNYVVNGFQVQSTQEITNNGVNANGNLEYSVSVNNATITDSDGNAFTYNSTRTYEWIEGESTTWVDEGLNGILDDVYLIRGTADGTNRDGLTYTAEVTEDLRFEVGCTWRITDGIIAVTPSGYSARTVDFGDGTCDRVVTATVAGFSFDILIR